MTAQEYKTRYTELMEEWANCGRSWLSKNHYQANANFYMDGVIDPETWFSNENYCRPLFVLKEVNETTDPKVFSHQDKSLEIDFVASYSNECEKCSDETKVAYDIWDGQEQTWRKIGALAKGILCADEHSGKYPEYHLFSKKEIDEYRDILQKISIINIKKFPGGNRANSEKSSVTGSYEMHANCFPKQLTKQIELINPTIIICCGSGIKELLQKTVEGIDPNRLIAGVHPRASKRIEEYYDDVVNRAMHTKKD